MRYTIALLTGAACIGLLARPATAQRPGAVPRSSFAHLVPPDVAVFAEWQPIRAKRGYPAPGSVRNLARLLSEHEVGKRLAEFDYEALIRNHLGMAPDVAMDELFGQRVAVAAASWDHLGLAVVLLRAKNANSLDPVIAADRARLVETRGDLRVYLTNSGLWVATDSRVAALSQAGLGDRLFRSTLTLLETGQGNRLGTTSDFTAQVGRLRRDYTAYLYFAKVGQPEPALPAPFADIRSGAIGVYTRPNQVDVEIHAVASPPSQAKVPVPIDAERMRRLPASTLVAWATSIDLVGAYERLLASETAGVASRYLDLAEIVLGRNVLETEVLAKLGPRMIVVWDQGHDDDGLPQVALLIESSDAASVAQTLGQGFATIAELFGGREGADDETVSVERSEHLDVDVLSVPLDSLLRGERGVAPPVELLASTQPAFAALDGWLVASPHPAAIGRIIEADREWVPQLASVRGLGLHWKRVPERRVELTVAQPAMASAVLAQWAGQAGSGGGQPVSKLKEMLGSYRPSVGSVNRPTLGIAIKAGQRPGSAGVVRVHAHEPAIGKLKVGDEIIGVDGRLLGLEDPVGDLRKWVDQCPDPTRLTLRVYREGELVDVVVPMPHALPPEPAVEPQINPLDALRRLQAAGRLLSYFNYTVYRSRPDQFHAKVALHFAKTAAAKDEP